VYVVLAGIKQVAVLDTSDAGNPRPLTRIALPGSQAPRNIAFSFSLERQRAFISDSESGRIQIIDAINHQRIGQLETGGRCAIGVKVSNFGRWLYVADRCLSTVYAIEVESLSSARPAITPIPLSPRSGAWYIAFSPDDRFAYVSLTEPRENISSGQIAIIDTEQKRQIGTIAVGGFPAGLQSWHALLFIFNPQSSIQRVSLDPATGAAIGFLPPISTGLTKELIGHFITLCCGKWKWARVGKELKYGYDMDDDGDLDVILDFQNSTFSYDVGGGQYVQIQTRGYVARDDPPGGRRVVVDYDTNGDGNPDRRTILNDTNMDGDFSEEGEVVDTPIGP
jgi:DNA-binding beta-propeller fold protein YncE